MTSAIRTLLVLAAAAATTAAEPVVVHFPLYAADGSNLFLQLFRLQDYDARLPDLLVCPHDAGAFGISEVQPAIDNNVPNWGESGTSDNLGGLVTDHDDPAWYLASWDTAPGTLVPGPAATGNWGEPGVEGWLVYNDMPVLRFDNNEMYGAIPCDYSQQNTEIRELTPVWCYPIRMALGVDTYLYGWMAVQVVDIKSFVCDLPCEGPDDTQCMIPLLRNVAVGFETDPDTPIIVGGGLCRADLTYDAILDLADLQLFITDFVSQQPPADQNDDGVYDLADVQAFIEAFTTGCGF